MSKVYKCNFMYISEEVLVQILKRLPVKSLLRFMSVCKSWYTLIKSPHFISTHFIRQLALLNSNEVPRYLIYYDARLYTVFYVHPDNASFERHLEVSYPKLMCDVGCSNGIVCFNGAFCRYLVLWNASLRKSVEVGGIYYAANDRENSTCWFGFDAASNDYKVVWIDYITTAAWETIPVGVYIYSLNEGTWGVVDASFRLDDECSILCGGVDVNGVIHWVVETCYEDRDMPELILTFSLADETFGEIQLPGSIVYIPEIYEIPGYRYDLNDRVDLMIVKRSGRDCLAALHGNFTNFDLWVLKEKGLVKSWRKTFSINRNIGYKKVINVRMKGEIILQLEDGGVVSLDPKTSRIKVLSVQDMAYVGTYMESLFLL